MTLIDARDQARKLLSEAYPGRSILQVLGSDFWDKHGNVAKVNDGDMWMFYGSVQAVVGVFVVDCNKGFTRQADMVAIVLKDSAGEHRASRCDGICQSALKGSTPLMPGQVKIETLPIDYVGSPIGFEKEPEYVVKPIKKEGDRLMDFFKSRIADTSSPWHHPHTEEADE